MMRSQDSTPFVGVDLHERESQLAFFSQDGSLLKEKRIPTGDLESFIDSLPGGKKIAIESVGFVYPIYDRLSNLQSCRVPVAGPNNVRLIARSRLKHDKADARILGELLRTSFLPTSYMEGEETREKRFEVADRVKFGLRRAQLKTTIRWLLKRRGSGSRRPSATRGGRVSESSVCRRQTSGSKNWSWSNRSSRNSTFRY